MKLIPSVNNGVLTLPLIRWPRVVINPLIGVPLVLLPCIVINLSFRIFDTLFCVCSETFQIDVSLISSLVTTLGSWKDRFFWVFESVILFKMVCRHPDAVLIELEPSESELNEGLLKALRACPSRLLMSALDFIKSDDISDVVLGHTEAIEAEAAIARTAEGRLVPGGKYVNVPNIKGFTKVSSSKPSTCRSSRCLKGPGQSSAIEHVDLSDEIEFSDDWGIKVKGKKELAVVTGKKGKSSEKTKASMAYMKKENESFAEKEKSWMVKVHELTKRHESDLNDVKKRMEADRLQLKADREALNVQQKAFLDEKEGLKASLSQTTSDNRWLIEHAFQQVVTNLLHSTVFNSALGDVYTQLLNHDKHLGFVAGYKAHESGHPQEQSSFYQPQASTIFKEVVLKMECLTYP
ncbi:hypothetical protein HanPI659440_Chr15g0611001 [Helianthus annuus]|nr:hypothetical protein HanPI659440_Chr15g0611001 [Helianthus annuus]